MKPNKDKRNITSKINGILGGRPKQYEDYYYLDGEVWKVIKEIPDYLISNKARIMSLKGRGKIMKPVVNKCGYSAVCIKAPNYKSFYIHKLVAEYFIPNPKGLKEVDHINGDKSNNSINNLRWVTHQENHKGYKTKSKNKSSKYRGVSFCKTYKKWVAQIGINGKRKKIGYYLTEKEAAKEWNKHAIQNGFKKEALNEI